jgi:hypothetical protein
MWIDGSTIGCLRRAAFAFRDLQMANEKDGYTQRKQLSLVADVSSVG